MSVLEDVRVLDLSEGIAPSIVGMFLADFGADAIKVERPGGDPTRAEAGWAVWNRGKRSVVCDPASRADRDWLAASVRGADVVILGAEQNLTTWGRDVAQAAAGNRRLVLVEMPAYLRRGAPWLGGEESNGLLAAAAAVSWRQASEDGSPIEPVYAHLLYTHALWATVCTAAALYERDQSGFGQVVTVTGINAVMEAATYNITVDPNAPDPDTGVGGVGRHPTYRPVRASDAWLACGALGPKFERRLLEILEIDDILDDPRLDGDTQNMVRADNMPWVMEHISRAFRRQPRAYWLERIAESGIPCGPLLDRDEWLDHPQIVANDLAVTVADPERGDVTMPGVPFVLTASPGRVTGPAPRLGAHNADPPWQPQPDVRGVAPVGSGPLSGTRVLNLGTFIATPYAGFLLAELGAEVIKVEQLTGDPFRTSAFTVNRGMKSLAVDLAAPLGHRLFTEVARDADVVIDGMRPGVMAKLGIDHTSLMAVNPGIISLSLSAYGTRGPLADAGGVDMVVQAMSGMMSAQGDTDAPIGNTLAIVDVATGAMSALATVLALIHRNRTGEGQRVCDSLVGTATFLSSGEIVRYQGRPAALRGGRDFKGGPALHRLYEVADGWVRVDGGRQDATVSSLKEAGLQVSAVTVEDLSRVMRELPAHEVVDRLARAGIPAVRVRRVTELFRDPDLAAEEFAHVRPSASGGVIATPGRYATFSRTQRSGPLTPPGVGEHTRAVLARAGVNSDAIDDALGAAVVVEGPPVPLVLGTIYR